MATEAAVPMRQRALAESQRFSASWLGLGEVLSAIAGAKSYQSWGFASFADYCRRELQLRQPIADKLARSFGWLAQARPQQACGAQAAPPLEVADLLSQVRERTQLSEAALQQVEQQACAGGEGLSRAQLLRQLRRQDPQAFRQRGPTDAEAAPAPAPAAPPPTPPDVQQLRKTLAVAERLAQLLAEQGLEAGLAGPMRALLGALRQRAAPAAQEAS